MEGVIHVAGPTVTLDQAEASGGGGAGGATPTTAAK
jgi:hypothetical protein